MGERTAIRRIGADAIRMLAVLSMLVPMAAVAAAPKEDETRRELRDAEHLDAEQLAARKEAADRAARAAAEALRLAYERADAAAKLRLAEAATADAAARIDALAARRRDAEQRLNLRAEAMQPLLPLIERLSLYPAETLLAVPAPPESALRGVLVLQSLSRQLEVEAEALRRDQAEVDAAAEALQREAPRLAEAEAIQKREGDALDKAIADAHAAQAAAESQAEQAASQAEAAAARMDSLRSALAALEAQRRADEEKAREEAARAERLKRAAEARAAREREAAAAEAARERATEAQAAQEREAAAAQSARERAAEAQSARERDAVAAPPAATGSIGAGAGPHGQLQPPVIGVVVKGWGEETDGGPATGVSYHAPPGAHVISPCGGRVVFANTFRSYGLLLIVDCGGGYHVVLSGFDRLDVRLGQSIVSGEPVGVMANWEPGSTAHRPALYVELRHDGQPINPAPWLRGSS
jgi:septal ring factor EnvC (AmiA/AmiB activator)